MRIKIFFILTCFISLIFADTLWVRWFDNSTDEMGYGVASRFDKIVQAGSCLTDSNYDPLIVIWNQNGNLLQVIPIGLPLDNEAFNVAFDNNGNFYLTGYTYQYRKFLLRDLIKKKFSSQEHFSFLFKFDSLGIEEWRRIEENKVGLDVAVDLRNNVYQTGTCEYYSDFLIKKYSPSGEPIWERRLDNSLLDVGYGIKVTSDSNILMVGLTGDFNNIDVFLCKLSSEGNIIWQRTYDFSVVDYGIGIDIDQNNNILISGTTGDFYTSDLLILKCDQNGNLLWSRTLDYGDEDQAVDIVVDHQNNIYVTGFGGRYGENFDLIILGYNPNGNLIWQEIYDFSSSDCGVGITTDRMNDPIISGYAINNINYTYDFLLMKLRSQVKIFENNNLKKRKEIITKDKIFLSLPVSGYYQLTIYDLQGRKIKELYSGYLEKGIHQFSLKDIKPNLAILSIRNNLGYGKNIKIIRY